jgi:glycosyltransferase 2 family protein
VNAARSFILRLAMGVGILGLVVLLVDVSDVWSVLLGLDPMLLLVAFACLLGTRVLVAFKWWLLLGGRAAALPYAVVQRAIFLADYQALLFPNSLAVDAMRLVLLRHHPRGMSFMAATIIADRVINVMVAAVMALVGMLLVLVLQLGVALTRDVVGIVLVVAVLVLAAGTALLSRRLFAVAMWVLEGVLAHGPLRRLTLATAAKARELHGATATLLAQPQMLARVVSVSVLFVLVRLGHVYFVFAALGTFVAVLPLLAIYPIVTLFVLLPITFLGLGVQDGAFIFFFGSLGVPASTALAASIGMYATILTSCVVIGLVAGVVGPSMPAAKQPRGAP